MSEEIRARLWNWGMWARGGMPGLEGRNGLWDQIPGDRLAMRLDVDDAERIEYTITSLAQPKSAARWRRYAFILKLYYCEHGMLKDKVKDYNARWKSSISERTFNRRLKEAESYVERMVPRRVPLEVVNSGRLRA